MEIYDKNINKQTSYYSKMGKILITIFLLMISLISVNALTNQHSIIDYPFESTSGTIVFDNSGNQINSILINGATFRTDQLKWGSANILCDGTNDYSSTQTLFNITDTITFSFWVRPSSTTTRDTWVSLNDGANEIFEIEFDGTNNNIIVNYYNSSGSLKNQVLENVLLPTTSYTHIVVSLDRINGKIDYYRDGQTKLLFNTLVGRYKKSNNLKLLELCRSTSNPTGSYYAGRTDSFKLFDFKINLNQVTELFTNDLITYVEVNDTQVINDTQLTQIINSTSPLNNAIISSNEVTFNVLLNKESSCDIYVDNNLIYSQNSTFAFTHKQLLTKGNHTYFLYCSYAINGTLYQQLSNQYKFELRPTPSTINFYFSGMDFDMNEVDLTLVTPCLNKGYGFSILSKLFNQKVDYYRSQYNKQGAYFFPIPKDTNSVSLQLEPDYYTFCLINGRTLVNEQGRTNNYNIAELNGYLNLGDLEMPNNVSQTYVVRLERLDIYNVYDPKAWGKTWSGIISSLILCVLGGIVLFVGTRVKNGKVAFVGALLLLAGMGISMGTLIGVLF